MLFAGTLHTARHGRSRCWRQVRPTFTIPAHARPLSPASRAAAPSACLAFSAASSPPCAAPFVQHTALRTLTSRRRVSSRELERDGDAGALSFDAGAQFFTASSPEFQREVAGWAAAGAASEWAGRHGHIFPGAAATGAKRLRPGSGVANRSLRSSERRRCRAAAGTRERHPPAHRPGLLCLTAQQQPHLSNPCC